MDFLSERFVNTQFVVTAHSPLVIQAALGVAGSRANLVVLRQEGDHVVIRKEEKAVRGWRIDQIANGLFGVSTYPDELETLISKRNQILSRGKLTKNDKKHLRELDSRIGHLPFAENSRDMEAMGIIHRAAERLKKNKGGEL